MQTEAFSELFPLLMAANPETLELLLSVAVEHEYPANRAVLMEDAWGNAVYFIASDVSALSNVKLISISAQRFIQTLFKDPQLHHRMLQLMVRRLRQTNIRFQLRHKPPAVKLANTLVALGENYGQQSNSGTNGSTEIFNIPPKDLADVSDIGVEETSKIMEKLDSKGWIKTDLATQSMHLMNMKQLMHLAGKV